MKTTIEQIRQDNKGLFAKPSKLPNGKWAAFHNTNSCTAICNTKVECIADLKDNGYTYTESNRKSLN